MKYIREDIIPTAEFCGFSKKRGSKMEELKKTLASLLSEKLYQIIISNPRQKAGAFKIKVRPVMVKEQVVFQRTIYEGTKVFHDNLTGRRLLAR